MQNEFSRGCGLGSFEGPFAGWAGEVYWATYSPPLVEFEVVPAVKGMLTYTAGPSPKTPPDSFLIKIKCGKLFMPLKIFQDKPVQLRNN